MLELRRLVVALAVGAGCVALGACEEDLKGGAACPVLCPEQSLELRDTILSPVSLDTTLVGYPSLGNEPELLLAYRGDTLQTAAVARFDTLADRVTRITDTAQQHLVSIDTANLAITIADTVTRPVPVTFEVYDVDTDAADLDTAAVRALFRSDRLLSTRTVARDSAKGEVLLPVPAAFLLSRLKSVGRVRLGVTIRTSEAVQFLIGSQEAGTPMELRYLARAATDTETIRQPLLSKPPTESTPSFTNLADYQIVVRAPPLNRDPSLLAVGGVPGARVYLRFALPPAVVESTTVVRATLLLTQRPNRSVAAADTVTLLPRLVRATNILNAEPGKAAQILATAAALPALRVTPGDTGVRRIEIPIALQLWRSEDPTKIPPAIVLQATGEGAEPQLIYFFSADAPENLRPRLELSYIPRAGFGLP